MNEAVASWNPQRKSVDESWKDRRLGVHDVWVSPSVMSSPAGGGVSRVDNSRGCPRVIHSLSTAGAQLFGEALDLFPQRR